MIILRPNIKKLLRGESYWSLLLDSGKEVIEGQHSFDLLRGIRSVDWYLETASTTDCAHIKEITLHTPAGIVTLAAHTNTHGGVVPYSIFQFKQGTLPLFSGEKSFNAQIIGRVDDKETGACTCAVWNALDKMLHMSHVTNIHNFSSWRRGTPHLGAINYAAMGVRL